MVLYLLNSAVITGEGTYSYRLISLDEARQLLKDGFVSAIGHQPTCSLLSKLLGVDVPYSRSSVTMEKGDMAIVFRIKVRLEANRELSESELASLPYEIGLLTRIK